MPTLTENEDYFGSGYDWPRAGDEWSDAWGTAKAEWEGCLYPRIFPFLQGRILEIGPGHGRWTQFLRHYCTSLIGVDVASTCVSVCRSIFKTDSRLHFEVNDGCTLPMVANASIDFAFSFDSLIHAEADIVENYVSELARVLKPNAIAFLHHSDAASLAERSFWDKLKRRWAGVPIDFRWRAQSMSAKAMRKFVERVGMSCAQQELMQWGTSGWPFLIDCMSTIINAPDRPCVIVRNTRFMEEAASIRRIAELARDLKSLAATPRAESRDKGNERER